MATDCTICETRYFLADLGRFTSQDPLRLAGGDFNLYRYAGNAPTEAIDPAGTISAFIASLVNIVGFAKDAYGVADDVSNPDFVNGVNAIVHRQDYFDRVLDIADETQDPDTVNRRHNPNKHPDTKGDSKSKKNSKTVASSDPNEKSGGAGFGTQAFIVGESHIPYRVNFENLGPGSVPLTDQPATAPATRVQITDTLSNNLDWSSLRFTEAGFGDNLIAVPAGAQYYSTVVPMTYVGQTFDVEVELSFESSTGKIRAVFQSIDPKTSLPPDVLTGFLPPEDGTGIGKGYIGYTVRPLANLASGTEIRNVALISFDGQTIIATNQINPHDPAVGVDPNKEALNTIDAGGPASSVEALAAKQSSAMFTVSWSGSDDAGGSGIGSYDVFVSDNGGPFTPWLSDTVQTTAIYSGEAGHTYGFYSVATDNVGNREQAPSSPDAMTFVSLATTATVASDHATGSTYGDLVNFTAVVAAAGGTPTGTVQFEIDGNDVGSPVALSGGIATFSTSEVAAANHVITAIFASDTNDFTDSQGNFEQTVNPAPLIITADDKSVECGAPVPELTASYDGFVNGDTPLSLAMLPVLSTTATSGNPPGDYAIMVSGAASPNYNITYVAGSFHIAAPAPRMKVWAVATDLTGNPITSITVGQQFKFEIVVQDVRAPIAQFPGVFSAAADVTFNSALSSIDTGQTVTFGGFFDLLDSASLSQGEVIGFGATSNSTAQGNGPQLLFSIVAMATGVGRQSFSPAFDPTVDHDSQLFGIDTPLTPEEISFVGSTLEILNAPPVAQDDSAQL